jgi:hypothetical protein
MHRFAPFLASLGLLVAAPAADAAIIHYELVFLLQPGDELLITTGGVTFDDSDFTPNGTVAADGFDLAFTFGDPYSFDLGGCDALTGYVDGSGTAVTALEGTCEEIGGGTYATSVDFDSDNTAYIDIPSYLLALNSTYTLVPEPGAAALLALGGVFVGALRRKA